MQCYPGGTYHLDIRQGLPKPFYEYYPTLIPQADIKHVLQFGNKSTIPPPPETRIFPDRQPSQPSTEAPSVGAAYGDTQDLPLGIIAWARSGDKGPDCNCGLWVRHAEQWDWLRTLLSVENVKLLLGKDYSDRQTEIKIERFELPNLRGVHFLFRGFLDRGVTSTSGIDFLGKNVAEFLRQRVVKIPLRFLEIGPPNL